MKNKLTENEKNTICLIFIFSFMILTEYLALFIIFSLLDLDILFIGIINLAIFGSILISFITYIDITKRKKREKNNGSIS